MPAATAVIQFVGIILFSTQIVPGGGLLAVAPRIPCPSSATYLEGHEAEKAMNDEGVEEHETILVFSDYKSANGWTPAQFTTLGGDKRWYVKLDGEVIRFIGTDSSNLVDRRNARQSRAAPRLDGATERFDGDLGLPHAGDGHCCAHPALRPEYTPETGYRLAAAVIDLAGVRGSGCLLNTGREDTIVNIDNDGWLIVEGTKGDTKKTITFDGSTYVVIANVPVDATGGQRSCKAKNAHKLAYAAMVQPCEGEIRCPKGKSITTKCDGPMLKASGNGSGIVPGHHTPVLGARTNAECSNNQWP